MSQPHFKISNNCLKYLLRIKLNYFMHMFAVTSMVEKLYNPRDNPRHNTNATKL